MTWTLTTIALLLIAYAALSRRLELANVSGAMFFTTTGLLAGPGLGLLDLEIGSERVKLLAEITLTFVLFADASRISLRTLRRESAVPLRLLGIGLPLTIVAGTLAGALVVPGISVAEAAVLAVVLACTDAALGQAVVTDERIPSRVRQGLNVESGLNDGLCVPIFYIAIAVAGAEAGTTSEHAAVTLVLEQIGYGLVGGVIAGIAGALILRFGAGREADGGPLDADPRPGLGAARRRESPRRSAAASSSPPSPPASSSARCAGTPAVRSASSSTKAASSSTPPRSSCSEPSSWARSWTSCPGRSPPTPSSA